MNIPTSEVVMKTRHWLWIPLALLLGYGICEAQPPLRIAGFVLGRNLSEFTDRLDMTTDMPVRYRESFHEVEMRPSDGFKSGLILYGTCSEAGMVLRIKLKYADASRRFYDSLLKRFKDRFGKPLEWRGDPFHLVTAWKWSFMDQQQNKISMILQHNTKDSSQKMGNALKITLTNLVEKEDRCFEAAQPAPGTAVPGKKPGATDWNRFIPRSPCLLNAISGRGTRVHIATSCGRVPRYDAME